MRFRIDSRLMSSDTTNLLRRIRACGLSQTEISKRTGIPQPRLSRWEGGASPAGADDALKLVRLEAALVGIDGAPPMPATAPDGVRDAA